MRECARGKHEEEWKNNVRTWRVGKTGGATWIFCFIMILSSSFSIKDVLRSGFISWGCGKSDVARRLSPVHHYYVRISMQMRFCPRRQALRVDETSVWPAAAAMWGELNGEHALALTSLVVFHRHARWIYTWSSTNASGNCGKKNKNPPNTNEVPPWKWLSSQILFFFPL